MTDGKSGGMIEVQCGDLIGPALDWAVAKAENVFVHIGDPDLGEDLRIFLISGKHLPCVIRYQPSSDWRFGGPLIQKYGLNLLAPEEGVGDSHWFVAKEWRHGDIESTYPESPTALIAVCRAIVSVHLGEVVSVPAELVGSGSV